MDTMDTMGEWVIPYDDDGVHYVVEHYDPETNDATVRAIMANGDFTAPFQLDSGALSRVVTGR